MQERPSILLAVVDLVERTQLEAEISRAGALVLSAEDPAELLRLAAERRPSVVLLAEEFSGAGRGLSLCRHLKADPKTRACGAVLVCGREARLQPTSGTDGGPDEVLVRPIHLGEVAVRLSSVLRLQRYAAEAAAGSKMDTLTGTFNHAYLLDRLRHEVLRAERYGRSLALVLLDIDGMAAINSREGATFGDLVLREVARALTSRLRGVDLVARSGPDDFSVVLPETSLLVARPIAERLRVAVESLSGAVGGESAPEQPVAITVSLGIAGLPHPDAHDAVDLLRCARTALGHARESGGNRSVIY
jgi:diguanylate cyclase (GGDEF)-like protein